MPLFFFRHQKKAAPLGCSHLNTPAELFGQDRRAELDLLPLEVTQRRPQIIYRDSNKHMSMAAEPLVWEEPSASLAGGDEDDYSLTTAASDVSPACERIPTTDSWLVGEYPSLYVKDTPEEDEEEQVSPMSSTETLVAVDTVRPKAAIVAAKLEAIAAEVPKKAPAARKQTLVPLAVAQARADIKYRAEGFEMLEGLQSKRGEKVWWKAC